MGSEISAHDVSSAHSDIVGWVGVGGGGGGGGREEVWEGELREGRLGGGRRKGVCGGGDLVEDSEVRFFVR